MLSASRFRRLRFLVLLVIPALVVLFLVVRGGGLAAARHLSNMGCNVSVVLAAAADELGAAPAHQAATLHSMETDLLEAEATSPELVGCLVGQADLVVDALLGYRLSGAPRGQAAALIRAVNASGKPLLSLDVPSGVDAGSGRVYEPSIKAAATLTLALPKTGLAASEARRRVGELYLADLSVPPALYRLLGLEVGPLFAKAGVIRLKWSGDGWATA